MRLSEFREYFALKRHLVEPWAFLRDRKKPLNGRAADIRFRAGFSVRLRDVPMDRHIFHRIFARDEYRLEGVAAGAWDTVLDVGAHIGLFAVRAAPLARRILCYEPSADNLELLRRNLEPPRFAHVRIESKAVAGKRGTVSLYPSDNPSAHSIVGSGASVPVECLTLEDIFREHAVERCDLLKLDCEGAEYEILRAVETLWPKIRRIRMEYHRGETLSAFLGERGYACEVLPSRRHPDRGHLFAERR